MRDLLFGSNVFVCVQCAYTSIFKKKARPRRRRKTSSLLLSLLHSMHAFIVVAFISINFGFVMPAIVIYYLVVVQYYNSN